VSGVWQLGGRAADVELSGQDHQEELVKEVHRESRTERLCDAFGGPDRRSCNPDATFAMVLLAGRFFNTATLTPRSGEHDVVAFIGVRRVSTSTAPPDVLRVVSGVIHCVDARCMDNQNLHFQDLGPVKRGERARLRVQWDCDNHRFIFQRDDDPAILAPYAVSDTASPGIQAKLLDAIHLIPNCTATPRPMGFIEALFDDALVNESAGPRSVR
jgi:hypothetical protein